MQIPPKKIQKKGKKKPKRFQKTRLRFCPPPLDDDPGGPFTSPLHWRLGASEDGVRWCPWAAGMRGVGSGATRALGQELEPGWDTHRQGGRGGGQGWS